MKNKEELLLKEIEDAISMAARNGVGVSFGPGHALMLYLYLIKLRGENKALQETIVLWSEPELRSKE